MADLHGTLFGSVPDTTYHPNQRFTIITHTRNKQHNTNGHNTFFGNKCKQKRLKMGRNQLTEISCKSTKLTAMAIHIVEIFNL